jgi:hypothetical protein
MQPERNEHLHNAPRGVTRIEHPMIGVVERQKAVGITALLEPEKGAARL